MIAAYRDVMVRPCVKCNKLFDSWGLQLPLIRQLKVSVADQPRQYLALHRECA